MPRPQKRLTVLLVDDDPEARDLLGAGLERAGFAVFAARGERDGTKYAGAVLPDLILLEFGRQSPLDSLTTGRRIRDGAALPADVMLVVYASREDETAREGALVEVTRGEYVMLPDEEKDMATLLAALAPAA